MREFEVLTSIESADEFIQHHKLVCLYFTITGCSVCHALQPKIQQLMMKYPEIQLGTINAQEVQEVVGRFLILTAPVLLLFVEGKEYVREARIFHLDLLDEKIRKIYDMAL
ncbi:Thioredoxin [compost metagenome]